MVNKCVYLYQYKTRNTILADLCAFTLISTNPLWRLLLPNGVRLHPRNRDDEVKKGFVTLVANNYLQSEKDSGSWARDIVGALKIGDLEQVRKLLTSFLADIPYTMRRKETERERERYFHYTFYLLMRMVSCYTVYTEKQQSEGRVDCIVETPDYIYIFEFKLDGTADEALQQIEEKGYARPYEADKRKLFKVGTVFSSETGTINEFKVIWQEKLSSIMKMYICKTILLLIISNL